MDGAPPTSRGRLIWHHHVSDDVERSAAFYEKLFGWTFEESGFGPPGSFHVIGLGRLGIGNLSLKAPGDPLPNRWMAYANVQCLDRCLALARAAGADVLQETELPALGARFACLRDPQGGLILPWEGEGDDAPERDGPPLPGTIGWNELASPDPAASRDFYGAVFGWTPRPLDPSDAEAGTLMERGPGRSETAVVCASEGRDSATWIPFVSVEDAMRAASRAEDLGARITSPVATRPGGRFVLLEDPVGARVAVLEPGDSPGGSTGS